MQSEHTFVICAYKESPYLEDCVKSVVNQTIESSVLIATSTDNRHIRAVAQKYGLEVRVSGKPSDIAGDWNYAYSQANTPFVTLAHQDDIYEPEYAQTAVRMMKKRKKPLIFFSDYYELRNGEKVSDNRNLKIKSLLLTPMVFSVLSRKKIFKKAILSLGNPICCPSVTYARKNLPYAPFRKGMSSNIDWQAWIIAARSDGDFVYARTPLMGHRIHQESTTTKIIASSERTEEDLMMFKQFWPLPIAKTINHLYRDAEKSNE